MRAAAAEPAATPVAVLTERQRIVKRHNDLVTERSSWLSHWQELNDYFLPRRLRYLQAERNRGLKRNNKIVNNAGTQSARTLAAGKMTGFTSPARPWWRYVPSDVRLIDDPEVKEWLTYVERVVAETLARSNIYSKLHETWLLQGVFATAAIYIEEDEKDDVRGYVFPLGQFVLASSSRGDIDTIIREFEYTVGQMVREFGYENCSINVRQAFRDSNLDQWIKVLHVVEPNLNRTTGKIDNQNMPFVSSWWEKSAPEDWDKPLRKSGYEEFPVMVARWDVIGEDVYGSGSPGMDSLGDNKALQLAETRKAEAVDKIVRATLKAPTSAKSARLSLLPDDTVYVDEAAQGTKVEPILKIDPRVIGEQKEVIREHVYRIQDTFSVDLFRTMQAMDSAPNGGKQPITAREVSERHEEKMLQLGPVVERDEDDVLDPMHNRIIGILYRRGKIPPVPQALKGQRVKIEYISVMAQAQKLLGTASTERFVGFIGSTSAVRKEILDIPNWDAIVKKYADDLGLPPDALNRDDVIAAVRQQRAQQEQAAAQQQASLAAVQGAKVASQADLGGDSVLSRLMNTAGGGGGGFGRA